MNLDQAAWLILGLDAITIVFTLTLLIVGGLARRRAAVAAGIGLVWLGVLRALFSTGRPFPEDISGVAFFAVVLVGVGAFGGVLLGARTSRTTLLSTDPSTLLAAQGIRVLFGATFLVWAAEDILPRSFGIVDGVTHASAGLLGLAAARSLRRNEEETRLPWIANIFGLADIVVVASSIAFVLLADIGPHHPMMYAVFGPAPIWLWFHVLSLHRLATSGTKRVAARESGPTWQPPTHSATS